MEPFKRRTSKILDPKFFCWPKGDHSMRTELLNRDQPVISPLAANSSGKASVKSIQRVAIAGDYQKGARALLCECGRTN